MNVVDGHCTRETFRICVLSFLEHVRILGMCAGKTGQLKRSARCELHSHAHAFISLLDHFRTQTAVAKFAVTGPALTQRLCSSCSCSSQAKAFSCSRMGILQAIPLLANPKVPCCNLSFVNFPPLAQRTIHRVFCLCTCRFSTLLFRKNNSTIIFLLVNVSRLPQDVFIYVLGGPSWHA